MQSLSWPQRAGAEGVERERRRQAQEEHHQEMPAAEHDAVDEGLHGRGFAWPAMGLQDV